MGRSGGFQMGLAHNERRDHAIERAAESRNKRHHRMAIVHPEGAVAIGDKILRTGLPPRCRQRRLPKRGHRPLLLSRCQSYPPPCPWSFRRKTARISEALPRMTDGLSARSAAEVFPPEARCASRNRIKKPMGHHCRWRFLLPRSSRGPNLLRACRY